MTQLNITLFSGTCALLLASCSYFSSPGSFEPFTQDHQREAAPEDTLRLRFSKLLVPEDWWAFRPEEVASVGVSPNQEDLYVGVRSGKIFCLKAADGKQRWSFETNGAITTRPAQPETSDQIFFASDDGNLYSLSSSDGSLRWKQPLKAAAESELALSNGMVVARLSDGSVVAFAQNNGEARWSWSYELPDGFTIDGVSAPKISRGKVFIGAAGGELYALDLFTGKEIWSADLGAGGDGFLDVDATPIVSKNIIYTASYAGGVYAISVEDGSILWRQALPGVISVVLSEDNLLFAVSADEKLYSLKIDSGDVKLSAIMPIEARGLVMGDPYLFVPTRSDGLWVLDRYTGRLVQRYNTGNGVRATPTITRTSLYLLSNAGRLYAFDLPYALEDRKAKKKAR